MKKNTITIQFDVDQEYDCAGYGVTDQLVAAHLSNPVLMSSTLTQEELKLLYVGKISVGLDEGGVFEQEVGGIIFDLIEDEKFKEQFDDHY